MICPAVRLMPGSHSVYLSNPRGGSVRGSYPARRDAVLPIAIPCGHWALTLGQIRDTRLGSTSIIVPIFGRGVRKMAVAVNGAAVRIAVHAATRAPHRPPAYDPSGTVAPELDQLNECGPVDRLGEVERGHGLRGPCSRGPISRPRTLNGKPGGDVHQGTRARTYTHSTPPWGQQRMRVSWPHGGAFALSGHPNQPSEEGVEMT